MTTGSRGRVSKPRWPMTHSHQRRGRRRDPGTTNAGIVDDLEGLGSFARETRPLVPRRRRLRGRRIVLASRRHLLAGSATPTASSSIPTSGSTDHWTVARWSIAIPQCAKDPRPAGRVTSTCSTRTRTSTTSGIPRTSPSTSRVARAASPFWFSLVTNGVRAYERPSRRRSPSRIARPRSSTRRTTSNSCDPASLSIVLFRRSAGTTEQYNTGASNCSVIRWPS